ncbi:GGDEF domain-containing protein [Mitsuaria sp. TWR114]|uniref:GGDEF domain-containing protein n=1 Tax=Mitsuaria sp. TWR114 TaxID=2601731 RepID=UPI0011BFD79E|nr:GGDEF domain-containing protein [Mitsuaria sp. TWR114]TXD92564.1 GGDEF domain-containing protein [Mitsuaria sp. TWR114]
MGRKRRSHRSKRNLASLRLEIAKAQVRLSMLQTSIKEARSDVGLAAVQDVRAENKLLVETNLRSEQAACASLAALDLAVKASQTDALTGLRNRSVLWDRLSHEMDLAGRLGQHVGVLLLDLDDFKQLNDRHGHAFGDLALQRVASVLTATVRASDTVCRLGGDEFVVVASTVIREDVDELVRKVTKALCEPFCVAGKSITVLASVGSSVYPEDGQVEAVLLRKADEAMYRVKRSRGLGGRSSAAPTP